MYSEVIRGMLLPDIMRTSRQSVHPVCDSSVGSHETLTFEITLPLRWVCPIGYIIMPVGRSMVQLSEVVGDPPKQLHPCSMRQSFEQPSPSILLPSSHDTVKRIPSPQISLHLRFWRLNPVLQILQFVDEEHDLQPAWQRTHALFRWLKYIPSGQGDGAGGSGPGMPLGTQPFGVWM